MLAVFYGTVCLHCVAFENGIGILCIVLDFARFQVYSILSNESNHFYLLFVEICETDLKRKISLCEELLKVVKVLEPGKSTFRGKLLVDLQEALFVQTEQRVKNGEVSKLVALVCIYFKFIHLTLYI